MPVFALTVALLAAAAVAVAWLRRQYRAASQAARKRVAALPVTSVDTPFGALEYIDAGQGPPVLVIHGIWGGCDQGLLSARDILGSGYRGLFASRMGYLGSALPRHPAVALQADLYAALLDTLTIESVTLLAYSAGSTSALEFALRYPRRVKSLILVSPNAPSHPPMTLPPRWLISTIFRSPFVFWLATTYALPLLRPVLGIPHRYQLTPGNKAQVVEMAAMLHPTGLRSEGALFDMFVSNPAVNDIPLSHIDVPILVVAARDDPLSNFTNSTALAFAAERSEIIALETGGHLLLGNEDTVGPGIRAFIDHHLAAEPAEDPVLLAPAA